jgi:hypothetical protein
VAGHHGSSCAAAGVLLRVWRTFGCWLCQHFLQDGIPASICCLISQWSSTRGSSGDGPYPPFPALPHPAGQGCLQKGLQRYAGGTFSVSTTQTRSHMSVWCTKQRAQTAADACHSATQQRMTHNMLDLVGAIDIIMKHMFPSSSRFKQHNSTCVCCRACLTRSF